MRSTNPYTCLLTYLLISEYHACNLCIVIAGQVVICQAKEMVSISKSISMKVKEKQGDITDDEVGLCLYA